MRENEVFSNLRDNATEYFPILLYFEEKGVSYYKGGTFLRVGLGVLRMSSRHLDTNINIFQGTTRNLFWRQPEFDIEGHKFDWPPLLLNTDSAYLIVRTSSLEETFLDPGFYWSWERFEDRWLNYFGYAEEDFVHTVVDVVANYNSLVCDDLKMFMENTQFIKVCVFLLCVEGESLGIVKSQIKLRDEFTRSRVNEHL